MPTTILDNETYEQARHRRFTEEAKAIEKMQQDEIIRMARELATRHGIRMCDEDGDTHGEELYCVGVDDIVEIIKQVAAGERASYRCDEMEEQIESLMQDLSHAVIAERKRCAKACYLRAASWKDNAARAAKLCGDAITAMGDMK